MYAGVSCCGEPPSFLAWDRFSSFTFSMRCASKYLFKATQTWRADCLIVNTWSSFKLELFSSVFMISNVLIYTRTAYSYLRNLATLLIQKDGFDSQLHSHCFMIHYFQVYFAMEIHIFRTFLFQFLSCSSNSNICY